MTPSDRHERRATDGKVRTYSAPWGTTPLPSRDVDGVQQILDVLRKRMDVLEGKAQENADLRARVDVLERKVARLGGAL